MKTKEIILSVILPVYNEEDSLAQIVGRIDKMCQENFPDSYEIIVVDDASTDKTAQIAEELDVVLLHNPQNSGAGYSRKVGIRKALGQYIFMIDADLTYAPEDFPQVLPKLQHFAQISGVRSTDHGNLLLLRLFIKFLARIVASIMTLTYIPDLNTGFKVLKRSEIMPYLDIIPNGFSCVTTMTVSHLLQGKEILFTPIQYMPRAGSSKFHPIKDTMRLFWAIFRSTYLMKPSQLVLFILHLMFIIFILSLEQYYILPLVALSYFLMTFINIYIRVQQPSNECTNTGL